MSYDKESLAKSWSYSQARKLGECPRKYYYNYVLDKKEAAGVAAQFSSMVIHPALARMYEGKEEGGVEQLHLEFLRSEGEMLDMDARFSLTTARKIVQTYIKHFGTGVPGLTSVMYEPRLLVEVDGTEGNLNVIVKPDVVFQDEAGKYIPLDFKVSQYERHNVDYEYQFVGQTVALGADRYMVDEITVSKAGKVSVQRHEVTVSEEHKQEWKEESGQLASQRNRMLASGVWPKYTWSCYAWGKRCQYMDACQAGVMFGKELL